MSLDLTLLTGYPENIISQVEALIRENKLTQYIDSKYSDCHDIKTDKALFAYVQNIKKSYMKKAGPVHKVRFDERIETVYSALGLHSFVSRIHGKNIKAKSEIRIASVFKQAPADFLFMIVIHELAHLKEKEHNRNFYRLCNHMAGDYSQLEFDLRVYLISLEE